MRTDPGGLSFVPLGVGDAFTAIYYTSCMALESGGRWILVDCPHPIRKILREGGAAARVAALGGPSRGGDGAAHERDRRHDAGLPARGLVRDTAAVGGRGARDRAV